MKKLLGIIGLLAVASIAQANLWNINWAVAAAYSPEGGNVLENYDITWSLFLTGDEVPLYKMESTAGDSTISVEIPGQDEPLSYGKNLIPLNSLLLGYTDSTGTKSVYQRLDIVNASTGDQYYWIGDTFDVDIVKGTETMSEPTDLDVDTYIGPESLARANAYWTKVDSPTGVPEPATMSLLGLGALAMALRRKLRK